LNDQSARIIPIVLGILGYTYRCSAFFSAEFSPKANTVGLFDGKLYAQRPWLPFLVDLLRRFLVTILFRSGREHQPPSQL
jgi:hypothetical protein